jgi:hypothetical protein
MSVTLEKDNPAIFNILPIRWEEDPVTSLSTINLNFENIDTEVCNLGFSAHNIWNKLYDDVQEYSDSWNSAFTTIQTFSGCWQSTYTTVSTASAGWLCPITVVFPTIITTYLSHTPYLSWLRLVFPTRVGTCVNYLNGQVLYLYIMTQTFRNQQQTIRCGVANPTNCAKFRCNPKNIRIKDRYVNYTVGLEFTVVDGIWTYTGGLGV